MDMNPKNIGPSFSSELKAAGAPTDGYSWSPNGVIQFNADVSQAIIDAVNGVYAAHDPTKPAPPLIPESVTRYQARFVLAQNGLLANVNVYFASLPEDNMSRLAWDEAPTVRRDSVALITAAHAMGLTDSQIDQMFIDAAAVI
jgi:hypothetical protein